jgi:hypothetical protein
MSSGFKISKNSTQNGLGQAIFLSFSVKCRRNSCRRDFCAASSPISSSVGCDGSFKPLNQQVYPFTNNCHITNLTNLFLTDWDIVINCHAPIFIIVMRKKKKKKKKVASQL